MSSEMALMFSAKSTGMVLPAANVAFTDSVTAATSEAKFVLLGVSMLATKLDAGWTVCESANAVTANPRIENNVMACFIKQSFHSYRTRDGVVILTSFSK